MYLVGVTGGTGMWPVQRRDMNIRKLLLPQLLVLGLFASIFAVVGAGAGPALAQSSCTTSTYSSAAEAKDNYNLSLIHI